MSERRRLEEIRRDFVANVSHELKTPMGALGLLAETLVAEPDPEVAQRLASRIHNEAFRVSRIIDDLLDLSRIESEEAPPREPVLVNLVMADAIERVRAAADARGIEIVLHEPYAARRRPGRPPPAGLRHARPARERRHLLLRQLQGRGIGHGAPGHRAHRATPDGGDGRRGAARTGGGGLHPDAMEKDLTLHGTVPTETPGRAPPPARPPPGPIRATRPAPGRAAARRTFSNEDRDMVRLAVQDSGIGIPARDLERIFERFYRVDHGRSRDTGGTGLGLSIVRHVANNHQGWVDVESREGEGSTFTLVLPLQAERVV